MTMFYAGELDNAGLIGVLWEEGLISDRELNQAMAKIVGDQMIQVRWGNGRFDQMICRLKGEWTKDG